MEKKEVIDWVTKFVFMVAMAGLFGYMMIIGTQK